MEKIKVFNRIGFGLLGMLLLSNIVGAVLILSFPAKFGTPIGGMTASYLGMYGLGLPLLLLLTKKMPKKSDDNQEKMSFVEIVKFLVMGLGMMYLVNMLYTGILYLLTGSDDSLLADAIGQFNLTQMFLLVVLFAPIVEELIFRKLFYQLVAPFGDKTYIIFSGIAFSFFHGNIGQSLYTFILGVIFAYVYSQTRNILYPIAMHMVVNFIGSFFITLIADNSLLTGLFGLMVMVVTVVGVVLGIRELIAYRKQQKLVTTGKKVQWKAIFINPGMILFSLFSLLMIVLTFVSMLVM